MLVGGLKENYKLIIKEAPSGWSQGGQIIGDESGSVE